MYDCWSVCRGTESYLAPELYGYGSEKCTNKVDVYRCSLTKARLCSCCHGWGPVSATFYTSICALHMLELLVFA